MSARTTLASMSLSGRTVEASIEAVQIEGLGRRVVLSFQQQEGRGKQRDLIYPMPLLPDDARALARMLNLAAQNFS